MNDLRNSLLAALFVACALTACGSPTNTGGGGVSLIPPDDAGSGDLCSTACGAQARANCSAFNMGSCVSSCNAALTTAPQCMSAFSAAARCATTATYTCNSSNRPTTMMCVAEGVAVLQCAMGSDGGTSSGDGGP